MNDNKTQKRGRQKTLIIGIGYPLLIVAAFCTMIPLLWLLSSSFKTADEVFAVPIQWLPKLPPRINASPYILSKAYPPLKKPDELNSKDWGSILPKLKQQIWRKIQEHLSEHSYPLNEKQNRLFKTEMIEGVWMQHSPNLPNKIWEGTHADIVRQVENGIISETVQTVYENVIQQVSVGTIVIEDIDFKRITIDSVEWKSDEIKILESSKTHNTNPVVNLSYNFNESNTKTLSTSLNASIPLERIRRIIIPIHGDSSYHQLSLTVYHTISNSYISTKPFVFSTSLWSDSEWRLNGIPGNLESSQIRMKLIDSEIKFDRIIKIDEIRSNENQFIDPDVKTELSLDLTIKRPPYITIVWDKLTTNYRKLWSVVPYNKYFINSVFIATASTLLTLFFCSLGGFAFAKYQFKGKKVLFGILLASMMIPFQVLLVPLFGLMYNIGWLNSYKAIIIPFSVGAFGVFLMRQFIVTIPSELIDAARIDGCSEFGIYYRIILPIIKPALGALTIYSFLGSWNGYLWPLIVLRDEQKYTLPIGLANLIGTYRQEYGMLMAGTLLSLLPIVVLFLAMQREFVQGITLGSVKE